MGYSHTEKDQKPIANDNPSVVNCKVLFIYIEFKNGISQQKGPPHQLNFLDFKTFC